MKTLHFNNHVSNQLTPQQFACEVFTQIQQNKDGVFSITVDDGDGDVYKYEIHVYAERLENITQPLTEN